MRDVGGASGVYVQVLPLSQYAKDGRKGIGGSW